MKVTFENVGRSKQTWTEEMREVSESALYRAVKKRRALASKEIYCDINDERTGGFIYAGDRLVGAFSIEQI